MSGTILIVEDERDLSATLEYALTREGFTTRVVHDGRGGVQAACELPAPDLVLLDLMLPDISGFDVCRELRSMEATRALPIIITSARAEEVDRATGFDVGADDFVVKPFSLRELAVRCRAVLHRRARVETEEAPARHGLLRIDRAAHRVWVGSDEIQLSALEFRLLTTLADRSDRVQTLSSLLAAARQAQPGLTTRTVDVHVQRLRDKLGGAADHVRPLRGVGYRFSADPREHEA
jgi:two-component system phosphate regulon response regulator PhoB